MSKKRFSNYFETSLDKFNKKESVIGILGLGYVGLPLALNYAENYYKLIGSPNQSFNYKIGSFTDWKSPRGYSSYLMLGSRSFNGGGTFTARKPGKWSQKMFWGTQESIVKKLFFDGSGPLHKICLKSCQTMIKKWSQPRSGTI